MASVSIDGAKITVQELVLVDEEAARILADMSDEDRPEAARRALKIGLIMTRDVTPLAKADFVRAEFMKLRSEIEVYWTNEVRNKIEKTLGEFFDPVQGKMPSALKQYLGDDGRLGQLFNEKNVESVPFKLRSLLEHELTGKDSTFQRALDPGNGQGPVGKLARELGQKLDGLRTLVLGVRVAAAVAA